MVSRAIGVHRQRWWILIISCTNYSFLCVCVCVCVCLFCLFVLLLCWFKGMLYFCKFTNKDACKHKYSSRNAIIGCIQLYIRTGQQTRQQPTNQQSTSIRSADMLFLRLKVALLPFCKFIGRNARSTRLRGAHFGCVNAIKGLAFRYTFTVYPGYTSKKYLLGRNNYE